MAKSTTTGSVRESRLSFHTVWVDIDLISQGNRQLCVILRQVCQNRRRLE